METIYHTALIHSGELNLVEDMRRCKNGKVRAAIIAELNEPSLALAGNMDRQTDEWMMRNREVTQRQTR